jgi:hypothetical protein
MVWLSKLERHREDLEKVDSFFSHNFVCWDLPAGKLRVFDLEIFFFRRNSAFFVPHVTRQLGPDTKEYATIEATDSGALIL